MLNENVGPGTPGTVPPRHHIWVECFKVTELCLIQEAPSVTVKDASSSMKGSAQFF